MRFQFLDRWHLSLHSALILAFALRLSVFGTALWWATDYSVFYSKDSGTYLQPAAELVATGTFSTNGAPEIMRTPGYPLLLTIGIWFGHVELITILLQILLSCLTCYGVYCITKNIFGNDRSAVGAAFLFSIEPLSILYSCMLLSDALFIFFLTAALNSLIRACQRGPFRHWLVAALLLAAAAYTRPVGYFLPLGLTVFLLIWVIAKKRYDLFRNVAIFCLLTMGLIGLWQVRNTLATGYAGFSTTTEIVLYFYHAGAVKAQQQGLPFYQVVERLGYYDSDIYYRNHPDQQTWKPRQRYAYLRQEGFKTLMQTPALYAQIYVRGLFVMLFDPGVIEYFRLFKLYQKSSRLLNVMAKQGLMGAATRAITENPSLVFWGGGLGVLLLSFYFLSIVGLNTTSVRNNLPLSLLLGTCFYFIATSGGIVAVSRFRAPVMPFIAVFAGHGLMVLLAKRPHKSLGPSQNDLALNL
ncbi:MAG: glycosyltransferase family 39 protein [Acidobacteria bacterium]|nr:glycosyltransferase family 39 protein [Acidobacteriota bacterium]